MQKRSSKGGLIWFSEFPEIAHELPTIFQEVGTVVWNIDPELNNPAIINMQINLHAPIQIGGTHITMPINSDKLQLITGYLKVNFGSKPEAGQTTLDCLLYLAFSYFNEHDHRTINDMRKELEHLAQKMKGRWDFM